MKVNDISKYIKKLSLRIPFDLQTEILNEVISDHRSTPTEQAKVLENPFWISGGLRGLAGKSWRDGLTPSECDRFTYLVRAHLDYEWRWSNCSQSDKIAHLLNEQLGDLLLRITRVAIIVQVPGLEVPAHRDLIVGGNYQRMRSNISTYLGEEELRYFGDEWYKNKHDIEENLYHEEQGFFGLRLPLSENINDNGRPFIQDYNGNKTYYGCGHHAFLLNEADVLHGADPVDFYRGVIIVDGKIDINNIEKYSIT
jgi:hypothetical protein